MLASEFTIDTAYRISRNAICQPVENQGLLMNASTSDTFGLDAMSFVIWQLMQSESRLAPVAELVSEAMAAPLPQVQQDVLAFANALQQRGFLEY